MFLWRDNVDLSPSLEVESMLSRPLPGSTLDVNRDLLQGVVRGWHDRLPGTVNTVKVTTK